MGKSADESLRKRSNVMEKRQKRKLAQAAWRMAHPLQGTFKSDYETPHAVSLQAG